VRAAQTVFERDGLLDARIADITATAGTATGSFDTYFNGKQEVSSPWSRRSTRSGCIRRRSST
jgi:hypothetical protein